MRPRRKVAPWAVPLLIAANLAIPLAIVIFAKGFFPYKPLLSGLAQYGDADPVPPPPAPFDRLVFMVVDALRRYIPSKIEDHVQVSPLIMMSSSDFVYTPASGFQFTQSYVGCPSCRPLEVLLTDDQV